MLRKLDNASPDVNGWPIQKYGPSHYYVKCSPRNWGSSSTRLGAIMFYIRHLVRRAGDKLLLRF